MRNLKQHNGIVFLLSVLLLSRCAGNRIVTSAHQGSVTTSSSESLPLNNEAKNITRADSTGLIDFGTVFPERIDEEIVTADTQFRRLNSSDVSTPNVTTGLDEHVVSYRYPPFPLCSRMVRVALQTRGGNITLYTVGLITVHSSASVGAPFRGRVNIQMRGREHVRVDMTGDSHEFELPCTLLSINKYNFVEYDGKSYRGAMIINSDRAGNIILVNYLDVEDYLRCVVPLEIGLRTDEEIEALKAQAVAARTYTYRRISERVEYPFDLTGSVTDQVYGGADAEYRQSDVAVKMTKDLVLTYGDSLVYAYYHSTCGGRTATIDQVWEKPAKGYLVSIADTDSSGRAYCSFSPAYKWTERWNASTFSSIALKNLTGNCIHEAGSVKNGRFTVQIVDVNPCGRVNKLVISGDGWQREVAGDRTRYVFRRNVENQPILRSSLFSITSFSTKEVVISGSGYGHGVGMCQMGAIGRARAGQSFETILKAYYTGGRISTGVTSF